MHASSVFMFQQWSSRWFVGCDDEWRSLFHSSHNIKQIFRKFTRIRPFCHLAHVRRFGQIRAHFRLGWIVGRAGEVELLTNTNLSFWRARAIHHDMYVDKCQSNVDGDGAFAAVERVFDRHRRILTKRKWVYLVRIDYGLSNKKVNVETVYYFDPIYESIHLTLGAQCSRWLLVMNARVNATAE